MLLCHVASKADALFYERNKATALEVNNHDEVIFMVAEVFDESCNVSVLQGVVCGSPDVIQYNPASCATQLNSCMFSFNFVILQEPNSN